MYSERDNRKKEQLHFPTGIILTAIFTVGAFLLIVYLSKTITLHPKQETAVSESVQEETVQEPETLPEEALPAVDPMVGSYSATSAVYDGKKLNSTMLRLAGYSISLDVDEDGTFIANMKNDVYEGYWYRDGSYVVFDAGNFSMEGTYSDDVLSLSAESMGISVVLEK